MRLKELREAKDLSQQKLSDEFKTTRQNISLYEKGDREPKIATLIKLADYFDVTLDYLVGREK